MRCLILVRHAQSIANRDGIGLGRADSPLTEFGLAQARATAASLTGYSIGRIVASPLERARLTAQAICDAQNLNAKDELTVTIDERFTEMDVGELEGHTWKKVHNQYESFLSDWASDSIGRLAMPGGESLTDVLGRVLPAFESLIELLTNPSQAESGDIVVVSHNFVLRVLICNLLGLQLGNWRSFELGLASKSTITCIRGQMVIVDLNNTAHLSAVI